MFIFAMLCYGLNICVPSNSYAEALSPLWGIFRDGAFGSLSVDVVIKGDLIAELMSYKKRKRPELPFSLVRI